MKKILFYCQHILGIGHLVRSMEIVRGLVKEFQVCFINGGEMVHGLEVPPEVEVINLPALKTDAEFKELQVVESSQSLEQVQENRKNQLLKVFDCFQPDILIIELFPFGRAKFVFELIPLLERAKTNEHTKVVCSLRDIVVTKKNRTFYEEKVCKILNQYFDLLLIHGDPNLVRLEESFSSVSQMLCDLHYTGYVVQTPKYFIENGNKPIFCNRKPMILTSVGGGRFGHELLECVVQTAPTLKKILPHHIQIFTGPFFPNDKLSQLEVMAKDTSNLSIARYTPQLLEYMKNADLSISMGGYNTTMNILTTGVRSMILPFTGNQDWEQTIRAEKLEQLGIVEVIRPEDLEPNQFAEKIISCLDKKFVSIPFNLRGVENTVACLKSLILRQEAVV